MFNSLNLCINYVKVLDIKKDSASAVLEKRSESNGVFIPSYLTENSRPFFATDNTNIKIDTPTGKHQLDEAAMAVFQQNSRPRQKLLSVFKENENVIDQTFHFMKI